MPPTMVTASASESQAYAYLSWVDVDPTATSVRVEHAASGGSWVETVLSKYDLTVWLPGLSCNTAYQFRVRVHRSSDDSFSAYAGPLSSTTAPCLIHDPPTNLAAVVLGATGIRLTWTNSATAFSVYIERSLDGQTWSERHPGGAASSQYDDRELTCGTAYHYRIRGRASDHGFSPYTAPVSATTAACSSLSAPLILWTSAPSQRSISVQLGDVPADATDVRAEHSTGGAPWVETVVPGRPETVLVPGLVCNTTYQVRVRVHRASDGVYSTYAGPVTVTTPPCLTHDPPTNLTAVVLGPTGIRLTWTNSATAFSVYIERSLDGQTWSERHPGGAASSQYDDRELTCGTAYHYRIRGRASDQEFSPYTAPVSATTTACSSLGAPLILWTSAPSQRSVEVRLGDVPTDATDVRAEHSTGGGPWVETVVPGRPETVLVAGLVCNTTYQVRIRVHRASDGVYSTYAGPVTVTTQPCLTHDPPTNLAAVVLGLTGIRLTWTNSATAFSVYIERSLDGQTWSERHPGGAASSQYVDSGLACGTAYHYRVRGRASDNEFSPYSPAVSATTLACLEPPSGFRSTTVSRTQVDLAWSGVTSDVTTVRIERSPDGTAWTEGAVLAAASSSSYVVTGLTCNTAYYFRSRVHRTADDQFSAYTEPLRTTTPACLPRVGPPGPPLDFSADLAGATLTATWAPPAEGAPPTGYILQAAQDFGFTTVVYNGPIGAAATSYTVNGVPAGVYYLRLLARNALGTSDPSNVEMIGALETRVPGAPLLAVGHGDANPVTFTWSSGEGGVPSSYTLVAALSPGGAPLAALPMGLATAFITNAPVGVRFYVRLIADNVAGQGVSNEVEVYVSGPAPPGAPSLAAPSVAPNRDVTLTWTPASSGGVPVSFAIVARYTPAGPIIASLPGISTTTFTVNAPPGTYYVTVVAVNALGSSAESNQIRVDVP